VQFNFDCSTVCADTVPAKINKANKIKLLSSLLQHVKDFTIKQVLNMNE
jgi:hypothetical protein